MNKTTSTLSNHILNTNSLEELAKDLSKRLKVNIDFGYHEDFNFEREAIQKLDPTYDFISLGKIEDKANKETFFLVEEEYCYRNLVPMYGKEIIQHDFFFEEDNYHNYMIESAENSICYSFFKDSEFDDYIIDIYQDSFLVWEIEDLEWWQYGKHFICSIEEFHVESIVKWRKETKNWISTFGGTEILVACMETASCNIIDYANQRVSWAEIKQKAKDLFCNEMLEVSFFYLNNVPNQLPNYTIEYISKEDLDRLSKGVNVISKNKEKYYEIYFDDFKDL